MLSTVAVIIPALNEEQSLPRVLLALPPVQRVVVVDNGSTDQTAEVARKAGADVVYEPRRGYGQACLSGISALQNDANVNILVILDADCADDPSRITDLVQPIADNLADLVLSERTLTAESGALLPHQRFGNALAVTLMAWVSGHQYRDMGPFRAIRWQSLQRLEMSDTNFGWNVEMQLKALRSGLRIQEIPLPYYPRVGTSKISGTVKGSIRAGATILASVWRYR